jgi:hypothetical protein
LTTSGCTADSLLDVCGVEAVIAISVPRETELREGPNLLQLQHARRGIAAPSKLQRLQSCKTGITAQKEPAGDNTGVSRRDVLLEIHNTCTSLFLSAASAATITTKTATVFRKE